MNGKRLVVIGSVSFVFIFFFTGLLCATNPPKLKAPADLTVIKIINEVLEMNSAYPHKKGLVPFTHSKHINEYNTVCGECHHDDKGQPLDGLKMSDDVQSCFDCHSKPGERPKGKKPKLSKNERLEYHAEALHYNCKGCHKSYNKKNKTRVAPTICKKCHSKK